MSCWVYIDGIIKVDVPGRNDEQRDFVVEEIVNNLPPVIGSEGNLEYYIIKPMGYKYWSSCNKYGVHVKGGVEEQTQRIIVVHGALRDAYYEESLREMVKALSRLGRYLIVNNNFFNDSCLINLKESWSGREYTFTNRNNWISKCFNEGALKNKLLKIFDYYNR